MIDDADPRSELPQYECSGCGGLEAELARAATSAFEPVRRLIGKSHLSATLRRCLSCRGLWLTIFTERLDWVDGDDPQYWAYVPISHEEAADLDGTNVLARATAYGTQRKFLICDWPARGPRRLEWTREGHVVGPHD